MTNTQRFHKLLHGQPGLDRLPVIEWAGWWDQTLRHWREEGLPAELEVEDGINAYWGQDRLHQFWAPVRDAGCPPPQSEGGPVILDEKEYEAIRPHLYTDRLLRNFEESIRAHKRAHEGEDYVYWFTLEGFFWFPRTLLGIENHLYAFYDYPELMHRINQDLADFHKRILEVIYSLIDPAFMTFAEDMSYNHGPMLSKEQYLTFMDPYYRQLTPVLREHGTKILIDTDGFVEPLIPWFLESGLEGILPLERMAGVDVNRIREHFPELILIGGFDKTVMHQGEEAMRAEFERILPAVRAGYYIPSVDHQTPPDVDLATYAVYMRLLREYAEKGVR